MKINRTVILDVLFITMIIVSVYLLYRFELFIEFFFLVYILLAIVFFFRFFLNNTEFVNRKTSLQEGIHTKVGDLEAQKNIHPIIYYSYKILHALSFALGIPAVLIIGLFKYNKIDDSKTRIVNRLYPVENGFFGFILFGTITTGLLHHYSILDKFYTTFGLIIILIILFSYLISTLLISNNLIDTFKGSVYNVRFSIVVFGVVSFLILFIPSFIFHQGTDEISFGILKEFNSNLLGYKKIRLYSYGVIEELTFADLLLSLGGFIFSLSTINSLKKAFTNKRTQVDFTSIAMDLNYIEKYKKSLKWLDNVKEEKTSLYWRMKGISHLGLLNVEEALRYFDRGIHQESADRYALDYKYFRLIGEATAFFISEKAKEQLINTWFKASQEKLFIAYYVILGSGKGELNIIERYLENNEEVEQKDDLENALAFRKQYEEESDKIEVFEMKSKSDLAIYLNAYMWCFVSLFSFNENVNTKNKGINEVRKGLNNASNEVFYWQLKIMENCYKNKLYQSVHYLFFLSVLPLKMNIINFRPELKIDFFNFYSGFVEYLKKQEREQLIIIAEHEGSFAHVFDST